jgi:DNA-binding CsgD family transcriptional regulator
MLLGENSLRHPSGDFVRTSIFNKHVREPVDAGGLNPLEWSEMALNTDDENLTITKLFKKLELYGFENGAFFYKATTENASKSFGGEFRYFGEIISPAWQRFMLDNQKLGSEDPMGRRLAAGNNCILTLPSIGAMPTLSKNEQEIFNLYCNFGFTAGVSFSNHDRKNGNFAALLLHHTENPDPFTAACTRKNLRSIHLIVAYIAEVFRVREMAISDEFHELSDREQECLTWSAIGCTTKEIADTLNLADATVNEYFNSAMRKLGANTRTQACARAYLLKLISP